MTLEERGKPVELTPVGVWLGTLERLVATGGSESPLVRHEMMVHFIRDIQQNAIEAAAAQCQKKEWAEDDEYSNVVLELLKEV